MMYKLSFELYIKPCIPLVILGYVQLFYKTYKQITPVSTKDSNNTEVQIVFLQKWTLPLKRRVDLLCWKKVYFYDVCN